jgi:predicted enzyme related to lactoylglutathione lyase
VLVVSDVVATAVYYRDVLGFSTGRFFGDPPTCTFVERDRLSLMLILGDDRAAVTPNGARGQLDLYVWVDGVDTLRRELGDRGVRIVMELTDTEFHTREFEVEDCNGYRLCFAQDTSGREDQK